MASDDKTFTKDELDAAITKAVGTVTDKLDELENKNSGLLDDLKKAQREARAAKDIKPEDLAAAEDRAEKAEAELTKARKEAKDATTAAEKAAKALETESAFTQKLLIQDGLKSALIAAGVKDEDHLDVLTAKYAGTAKVVVDGEERKALIGDKPLPDFFKEWSGTETAKKYIAAPTNSGGGSGGGRDVKANAKTMTRSAFDSLDQMAQGEAGLQMAKGELKIVDEAA